MKIALVTPYEYPYPGGVTEHISALDREFRARGHDTRILAPASNDAALSHVLSVSASISPISYSGSKARITLSPRAYRRVKRILAQEKFDVIHVHEPGVPILSLAVLRHSHTVNVGTFHAYRESSALYEYGKPLADRIYGKLNGRIFVSEAVRDYILHYFPGDYTIIPNGIDVARYAADLPPLARYTDGRPTILFLGRLEARKGFRFLFEAFRRIKAIVPEARLIVAGAYAKEEKEPFIRQARATNLRGIHFVGWASDEEKVQYYRAATVFCAPSTGFESFGIVLLEAMAAGTPVVASDIAGYRAVLGNTSAGLLVPPEDPEAIAEALICILRQPGLRQAMSESGQRQAAHYDWPLIAGRVLDYYQELVARAGYSPLVIPPTRRERLWRHFRIPTARPSP